MGPARVGADPGRDPVGRAGSCPGIQSASRGSVPKWRR
ncbi:hypothetical protein MC885_010104, partial [Smutsia gigantea]